MGSISRGKYLLVDGLCCTEEIELPTEGFYFLELLKLFFVDFRNWVLRWVFSLHLEL